ncbi:M20 metallopeptidase family protein [Microbacterium sp. RD1]|uniref:M20 metallopeptidase family protein n=1 Tax=Microbacterium sp. RD1 TaxID=3457313 RepID=UPI003FA5B5DC
MPSQKDPGTGDVRALRRRLHAIPEVGLDLPETQRMLRRELEGLPVRIIEGRGLSSLAVIIEGASPGPTVLLRADMDALPLTEESGEEFSATGSTMHACGHDLHMAALVGAIRLLCARRDDIEGTVLAIFQPGEEGHGGAARMIADGVLETTGSRPVASYGIHVFSFLQSGVFLCRPGAVMGTTVNFRLSVVGRGGHAARPHTARNPILPAALIVQAVQNLVTQNSTSADPLIATIGSFQAGDAPNVITDRAVLGVSLRALSVDRITAVRDDLVRIAEGIAGSFDMSVSLDEGPLMPPTVSDPFDARLVEDVVTDVLGPRAFRPLEQPEMIAEDFSLFLEETGGAFLFVGAGSEESGVAPNHSSRAVYDDAVVPDASRVLAELAVRRLAGARGGR